MNRKRKSGGGKGKPPQHKLREPASVVNPCIGLDLGGSLTKICYFEDFGSGSEEALPLQSDAIQDDKLSFASKQLGGWLRFIYFQTPQTRETISVINSLAKSNTVGSEIHATGGGAIKFAKFIKQELGVSLLAEDELETVVRGIVFTLLEHPQTCYTLNPQTFERMEQLTSPLDGLFPLLVVNIGSGVSIIKVDSPDSMRRVSGTAVGGGTFYGLCKLLTRCESFDEAMDMADRGDANQVNMLVSDIYGGSYERVGLLGSITASFFGKTAAGNTARARPASSGSHEDVMTARREKSEGAWFGVLRASAPYHFLLAVVASLLLQWYGTVWLQQVFLGVTVTGTVGLVLYVAKRKREFRETFRVKTSKEEVFQDEDIARALVTMISQNVTQIAYLNARMHQTKRIVFTGNFLRHNAIALRTLTSNLALFSGGEIEALFTEHEGFFGALGACLMSDLAKSRLERTVMEAPSRGSSFHAPEAGDDGFYLSSPQITPNLDAVARSKTPDGDGEEGFRI